MCNIENIDLERFILVLRRHNKQIDETKNPDSFESGLCTSGGT